MKKEFFNKKIIIGWAMYDWANSVYNLIITTTFFPIYYIAATQASFKSNIVSFLGWHINNTVLYDYAISFAYLLVLAIVPFLASIADYRGNKLIFLKTFSLMGALGCSALYFFNGKNIVLGIVCFVLATIGYCGSIVFYNSYLPEIAPENKQESVSAKGYMLGYIGSVLVQIIGFLLLVYHPWGIQTNGQAIRITFLIVGIWWLGFAQFSFSRLSLIPKNHIQKPPLSLKQMFTQTFTTLVNVGRLIKDKPTIKKFLWAYFFYNMGVQTVMLVAISFGTKILHIADQNLLIVAVLLQVVAIAGAYFTSKIALVIGDIKTIILINLAWILVCVGAYHINTQNAFYGMAMVVGLVMGAIQSMSRATFSKLMPPTNDHTAYFSFYDVVDKLTVVVGLFCFGFIEQLTNNMRNSVLLLILFFIVGIIFLIKTLHKTKK